MHQNYCGASPGYPWDLILRLGSVTTPSQADETGDPTRESPHDRGADESPQLYGLSEAFTILGNQEPGTTEESQRLNDKVTITS